MPPEPYMPTPAKVFGRENMIFIPTTAGYATGVGPTAVELTGASALDITNVTFADSAPDPTQNTNLVEQNRRFGQTTVTQFVGTTTVAGGQMTYAYSPQAAAGSPGKKAWETFKNVNGPVSGYLVDRMDVPTGTAPAAGQFVDVYPVEIGPSKPTRVGQGEAAEAGAMATFAVTGKPLYGVAIS